MNSHCQQHIYLRPSFIPIFNFSHKWPTFAFTGESAYTLAFQRKIAHNGTHAETGGISDGGGITTLNTNCTFTNIPGPGVRTAYFAAFGPWPGALLKNTESLRDSDALMRVAVPRRRGPAGLRCSVCNLVMLLFFALRAGLPTRARRRGITILGTLHVLLNRLRTVSAFIVFTRFFFDFSGAKYA